MYRIDPVMSYANLDYKLGTDLNYNNIADYGCEKDNTTTFRNQIPWFQMKVFGAHSADENMRRERPDGGVSSVIAAKIIEADGHRVRSRFR